MRSAPIRPALRPSLALPILLAVLAMLCLLAAAPAQARPNSKFTVGIGAANNKVSGDFDGTGVYTPNPATGPNSYSAKLDQGSGPVVLGGVHFNDHFGVDGMIIVTAHDGTSQAPVLAGQKLNASVTSFLVAARAMAPMGDHAELFGRLGLGVLGLTVEKNTELPPSTVFQDSHFSGSAVVVGVGLALFFGEVGLEIGVLNQNGKLTSVSAAGQQASIPDTKFKLNTAMVILTGHWGK